MIGTLKPCMQDFHPFNSNKLLSGGMDDTIKIWTLKGKPLLREHIFP